MSKATIQPLTDLVHCFNQGRPFDTARAFNDLKRKMNTEEPSQ